MKLQQAITETATLFIALRCLFLGDRDTRSLSQSPDRSGEIHPFVFHDEFEHAAARAAAKAVVGLLLRADMKGRGFFSVKRA
jgi:hypothetical protein